jgi:drug/metabolite transporter (DMT)-like permease
VPTTLFDSPRRAYALIVLSSALFAAMFACVKLLPERISSPEGLFVRGVIGVLGAWLVLRATKERFRPGSLRINLIRSCFGVSAVLCHYFAVHEAGAELATANLMSQSAPLWILLLSGALLGEHAAARTKWALALGLVGTLLALGPSGAGERLGLFSALSSGALSAMALIYVRKLASTENPASVVLFFMSFSAIVCAPFALLRLHNHGLWSANEFGLLLAIGALGTAGQLLMTYAYRHGTAATVSITGLAQVAFAAVFSFAFLGAAVPSPSAIAGGIMVLAAGVFALQPWRSAVAVRPRV